MITIGKINTLKLVEPKGRDIYLEALGGKKLLLVGKPLPKDTPAGTEVNAFVYVDMAGHPVASIQMPKAQVDEFAWLKVIAVNYYGAFLDWGLQKDLLLPFSEQYYELEVGKSCLVRLFLDEKERIIATTKIEKYLLDEVDAEANLVAGKKVSLIIADKTELGFKAIVNNRYWGLLYKNELYQIIRTGQHIEGYIKQIRPDNKIDLSINEPGYAKVDPLTATILQQLSLNGGELKLSDKSPPEEIYRLFGVSKKVFKQAIGALCKNQTIIIEKDKIKLVN